MKRLGRFEGQRGSLLMGWAYDPLRPWKPLAVQLRGDNGACVDVVADRHRLDVHKAGHGDGYCGFAAPAMRFVGARRVECRFADTGAGLAGSPFLSGQLPPVRRFRLGTICIVMDRSATGTTLLQGYVVERSDPSARFWLGLFAGDAMLERTRACLYRPEAKADGGDGFNGFLFRSAVVAGARLTIEELGRRRRLIDFPSRLL